MIDTPRDLRWTAHALERWREHHPAGRGVDLIDAVRQGSEESPALIQALTGRAQSPARDTRYVRSADGRGVFVLVRVEDADQIRTYLRLGEHQRAVAAGEAITGSAAHAARRKAALKALAVEVSAGVRAGRQPPMARLAELAEGTLWLLADAPVGEAESPREGA